MTRLVALAALLAGCGDDAGEAPANQAAQAGAARADAGAAANRAATDAGEPRASEAPPALEVEPAPPGVAERALIEQAGALPAWGAVLERGTLLARRGERGAVWGRVGPEQDAATWLLDETITAAPLGIRLAGDGRDLAVKPGERVIAWGAWTVDGRRRWIWRVSRMVALPDAPARGAGGSAPAAPVAGSPAGGPEPAPAANRAASPAPLPAHLVGELAAAPSDAVPPSTRQDAGLILFRVVAPPAKPGDGWTIADQPKGGPSAALVLPGEAPVYGGLDYLASDERWPLAPGSWYVAEVAAPGRTRRQPGPDELPVLRATAPPARVPPPPPRKPAPAKPKG